MGASVIIPSNCTANYTRIEKRVDDPEHEGAEVIALEQQRTSKYSPFYMKWIIFARWLSNLEFRLRTFCTAAAVTPIPNITPNVLFRFILTYCIYIA